MKVLDVGSIMNITEGDMFKLILLKNPKKKFARAWVTHGFMLSGGDIAYEGQRIYNHAT